MPINNKDTMFAEAWAMANEKFYELDHLSPINMGFTQHFMSDSETQTFLSNQTIAELKATKRSRLPGLGSEKAIKIPFIERETGVVSFGKTEICSVRADRNQVTKFYEKHPIDYLTTSLIIDDHAWLDNGINLAEHIATAMKDSELEVWDRLELTMQGVVEANKNQSWAGISLPPGWAIVGDAIQIPYADISKIMLWIPIIFRDMRMKGAYNVTIDSVLSGFFIDGANQGTGNAVNTAYQYDPRVTDVKVSQSMPTPPLGVSHVIYAQKKDTSVMFSDVPSVFRTENNRNINGEFSLDWKINGQGIKIGNVPFDWGMKTLTVCNPDKYHGDGVGGGGNIFVDGQPEQERIFTTSVYGIIQEVSNPATLKSPVLRLEVLDPV